MKSITAMLLSCLTLSCAAGVDAPAPDNINSPTAAKSDGHSADAPIHPFKCSVSDDHLLECQAEHPFFETTSMAIQTGDGAYVGSVVLDKNQPTQTFQLAADEYPYGLSYSVLAGANSLGYSLLFHGTSTIESPGTERRLGAPTAPFKLWSIHLVNDTDDYALVAFDSYTIDQSDSLYLSQTDDGVSPQLYPRSIDLEAGESIVLTLPSPADNAAIHCTGYMGEMVDDSDIVQFTLKGEHTVILDSSPTLTRDADSENAITPDAMACDDACEVNEVCLRGQCVRLAEQQQDIYCNQPWAECDVDAQCNEGNVCVQGFCRRLTCQAQDTYCNQPKDVCDTDAHCDQGNVCVQGLCYRIQCLD